MMWSAAPRRARLDEPRVLGHRGLAAVRDQRTGGVAEADVLPQCVEVRGLQRDAAADLRAQWLITAVVPLSLQPTGELADVRADPGLRHLRHVPPGLSGVEFSDGPPLHL